MKRFLFCILVFSLFVEPVYGGHPIIFVGDRIVRKGTRLFAPETLTQIARIEADGGTVIDAGWMDLVISILKAQSIYSNCKFLADANFAVKKDGADAVSVLYDISGNNNDAVQATGAAQPIWTAAQQNGKAGLVFDGSDDVLSSTSNGFNITGPFSILSWGNATSWPGLTTGIYSRYVLNSAIELRKDASKMSLYIADGSTWKGATALEADTPTGTSLIYSGIYDGTNIRLFINGILKGGPTATSAPGDTTGETSGFGFGRSSWHGNLPTFLILNTSLTTAQRTAIEALVNNYYAIY